MMARLLPRDRFPIAGDRARAGHVNGLDAFLDSHLSVRTPTPVGVPVQADWAAPPLHAALVYDTAAHRLPSGIRALVRDGRRRLMFAADEYEVVLHVEASDRPGRVGLVGQLLYQGLPLANRRVRASSMGTPTDAVTGRAGAFHLPALREGTYELEVALGPSVLTASGISLPGQASDE